MIEPQKTANHQAVQEQQRDLFMSVYYFLGREQAAEFRRDLDALIRQAVELGRAQAPAPDAKPIDDSNDSDVCRCGPRGTRGWRDPHCPDHGEFPIPPDSNDLDSNDDESAPPSTDALASASPACASCAECAAHEFRQQALQDSIDGCAQRVLKLSQRALAAEALQQSQAEVFRRMGELLKTGGMHDPYFLLGQVTAMVEHQREVTLQTCPYCLQAITTSTFFTEHWRADGSWCGNSREPIPGAVREHPRDLQR